MFNFLHYINILYLDIVRQNRL